MEEMLNKVLCDIVQYAVQRLGKDDIEADEAISVMLNATWTIVYKVSKPIGWDPKELWKEVIRQVQEQIDKINEDCYATHNQTEI